MSEQFPGLEESKFELPNSDIVRVHFRKDPAAIFEDQPEEFGQALNELEIQYGWSVRSDGIIYTAHCPLEQMQQFAALLEEHEYWPMMMPRRTLNLYGDGRMATGSPTLAAELITVGDKPNLSI